MPFGSEILGGILVGLGMAITLLYESQISGASGYAAASLRPSPTGRAELYFVAGLVLAGLIWRFAGGHLSDADESHLGLPAWILAGLLVGFGARLGGGCTSGHGVCGLGRLSHRSLAAVLIFMAFAFLTAAVMRIYL
ncbi:MAG: YeeE/YedE thiosulfate transporter family protein [Pseudomonadota bacterium]